MGMMASQITSLTIVYSTVYSDADQRKHQSSASPAFARGMTGEFPAQMASNAENVSIWWRHHETYNVCGTLVGNTIRLITQLRFHSRLNTRLQWIERRQLQDQMGHI